MFLEPGGFLVILRHALPVVLTLPFWLTAGSVALSQTPPAAPPGAGAVAGSPAGDDVTNPAAPVPQVAYRSVFVDTPVGVETEEADWRRANAEVGQFQRGHVDILRWEAQQGPKP